MRVRFLLCPAVLMLLAACDGRSEAADTGAPAMSISTTAACADAPQLRQRATDEPLQGLETSSDQTRIVLGNRAKFFALLTVVAELRCIVTLAEADQALEVALNAARNAEGTSSFYEQASRWAEANFAATRVIEILVKHLPAPAAG